MRRLVILGSILLLGVGALAPPSASGAAVSAGARTAHPFSAPIWYPLGTPAMMGCDHGNPSLRATRPTCRSPRLVHPDWGIDLLTTVRTRTDPRQPVYAMGAGIVHYGATHQGCGGATSTRGNYLWIDHGDGVYSYYGHLSSFSVKNGQYVSARTRIGTLGNTGSDQCRRDPTLRYLFVQVSHGGRKGHYVPVSTMYACAGGKKVAWPRQLPGTRGRWKTWNDVPRGALLPAPGARSSCIPTPPATPNRPARATLRHSGSLALAGAWTPASTGRKGGTLAVVLQGWHPVARAWWDERTLRVSVRAGSHRFTHLHRGRTYRLQVYAGNSVGWSAPASTPTRKARQ